MRYGMNIYLKKIRSENNLTHKEMANLIGLKTASAYYKKEMGSTPFSLNEAKIISEFFDKTIEDIFFDNELS
jgi:DNA-binding XRE family transcriptional regulator